MKADLIERLAQRAEAEGLLDVAYAEVDSPLGKLLVATTPKGIVRLGFPTEDHDVRVHVAVQRGDAPRAQARAQLVE